MLDEFGGYDTETVDLLETISRKSHIPYILLTLLNLATLGIPLFIIFLAVNFTWKE